MFIELADGSIEVVGPCLGDVLRFYTLIVVLAKAWATEAF